MSRSFQGVMKEISNILKEVYHARSAVLVAVGNCPSYGGGMRIAPDASYDDGLLDVVVVGRMSVLGLVRAFPTWLTLSAFAGVERVFEHRTDRARRSAPRSIPVGDA